MRRRQIYDVTILVFFFIIRNCTRFSSGSGRTGGPVFVAGSSFTSCIIGYGCFYGVTIVNCSVCTQDGPPRRKKGRLANVFSKTAHQSLSQFVYLASFFVLYVFFSKRASLFFALSDSESERFGYLFGVFWSIFVYEKYLFLIYKAIQIVF